MQGSEKRQKGRKKKTPSSPFISSLQPENGGSHKTICSSSSTGTYQYLFCHDVTSAPRAEHRSANIARQRQDTAT